MSRQLPLPLSEQLPLPLTVEPSSAAADFVADASNAEAREWLAAPARWPNARLAIWGEEGVGKSHLLRATAADLGWPVLAGPALRGLPELPAAAGLALDEADAAPEEAALLHLINWAAEGHRSLLLAGREPPARWPVALPDLRSRLRATTAVALHPPGDRLLAALLDKQLADRQLQVDPRVKLWLLARLPRRAAAVGQAVAQLDAAALATGRRITLVLARGALAERLEPDDDSMAVQDGACHPAPGLL